MSQKRAFETNLTLGITGEQLSSVVTSGLSLHDTSAVADRSGKEHHYGHHLDLIVDPAPIFLHEAKNGGEFICAFYTEWFSERDEDEDSSGDFQSNFVVLATLDGVDFYFGFGVGASMMEFQEGRKQVVELCRRLGYFMGLTIETGYFPEKRERTVLHERKPKKLKLASEE